MWDDSGFSSLPPWVSGHNTHSHPPRPCQMQLLLWALGGSFPLPMGLCNDRAWPGSVMRCLEGCCARGRHRALLLASSVACWDPCGTFLGCSRHPLGQMARLCPSDANSGVLYSQPVRRGCCDVCDCEVWCSSLKPRLPVCEAEAGIPSISWVSASFSVKWGWPSLSSLGHRVTFGTDELA